jgi:aldehyde:ferredoxin oxidoreductase
MSINPINDVTFTQLVQKYKQTAASKSTYQAISQTNTFDYTDLAQRYDIRNCTFEEFCKMVDELYEAGELSFREHSIMTIDKRLGRAEGEASPFFTTDDMYGKIDWIAEYIASAEFYFKAGVIETYASDLNILSVLKKLDR